MPAFKEGDRVRLLSIYKMPTEQQIRDFMRSNISTATDFSEYSIPSTVGGDEYNNPVMMVYDHDLVEGETRLEASTTPVLCGFPTPGGGVLQICFAEHTLEYMGSGEAYCSIPQGARG
jgi:hypothetical protein